MEDEKKFFDMVDSIGEGDYDKFDIHDISSAGVTTYRMYHKDGFCITTKMENVCSPSEVSYYSGVDEEGNAYSFDSDHWEGFDEISIGSAIEKLLEHFKSIVS